MSEQCHDLITLQPWRQITVRCYGAPDIVAWSDAVSVVRRMIPMLAMLACYSEPAEAQWRDERHGVAIAKVLDLSVGYSACGFAKDVENWVLQEQI